jgi:hypothetical protein
MQKICEKVKSENNQINVHISDIDSGEFALMYNTMR